MKSDFAIIDVKEGRDNLLSRVIRGEKVRVLIEAEVDAAWGDDDGVSREFAMNVFSVKEAVHAGS